MNFDLFYTEKKPNRLTKKERDKLMELIFNLRNNPDKKIELFLFENWNKIFKSYAENVQLKYVKNRILYVEVSSKAVFQDIIFLLSKINELMSHAIGETIRTIRMVPSEYLKNQRVFVHTIDDEKKLTKQKKHNQIDKTQDIERQLIFIQEIKSILKK